jgi:thiol-disulfide isomerase/thioredoxin
MTTKSPSKNHKRATAPAPAQAWWQSPIAWAAGLVGLAVVVAIAMSALSADSDLPPLASETADAAFTGTPLPPLASPDVALGMRAPEISATDLSANTVNLTADGTARLYGFFAHWCPHCQAELPKVAEWLTANPLPDNVEVVAVSTSVDRDADNYPPSEWFEREGWPSTVLVDSATSTLGTAFGLTAFPYWVAVDAEGTVVARFSGAADDNTIARLVGSLGGDA